MNLKICENCPRFFKTNGGNNVWVCNVFDRDFVKQLQLKRDDLPPEDCDYILEHMVSSRQKQ